MLASPSGRDQSESPKAALDRAEQLIYADHLDSIGHHQGAAFFRLNDEIEANKIREKRERMAEQKSLKMKAPRKGKKEKVK